MRAGRAPHLICRLRVASAVLVGERETQEGDRPCVSPARLWASPTRHALSLAETDVPLEGVGPETAAGAEVPVDRQWPAP